MIYPWRTHDLPVATHDLNHVFGASELSRFLTKMRDVETLALPETPGFPGKPRVSSGNLHFSRVRIFKVCILGDYSFDDVFSIQNNIIITKIKAPYGNSMV